MIGAGITSNINEYDKTEFVEGPATVALMDDYLEQNGYVNDLTEMRLHHEIYMSDARKVPHEKWKTVIRHPIKKKYADSSL